MDLSLKNTLLECSLACKESYETSTIENKKTDTQVYIKNNIIVWRGTSNLRDWMTNLDMDFIGARHGKFHHGFWKSYTSVSNQVEGFYHSLKSIDKNKSVIITGHSLGGALALENGIDFLEKGYNVQGIYTFGQPRTLHRLTAAKLKKKYYNKIFRCVHNNDVVPRVPFSSMGYGHLGQLIYFGHDMNYIENTSWARIKLDKVVGRLKRRFENLFDMQTDGISDHNIKYYQRCVSRIKV